MPSYKRSVQLTGKTSQELFDVVQKEIHRFFEKTPAVGEYKVVPNAADKTFSLESKVVKATLYCEEGQLRLEGQLSLMLMPFRSKIDSGIDRWVHKIFGLTV